jgi:3',5'-cyclic AMP phosphodiesterase CpdA
VGLFLGISQSEIFWHYGPNLNTRLRRHHAIEFRFATPRPDTIPPIGLGFRNHSRIILGNHDIWSGGNPLMVWWKAQDRKAASQRILDLATDDTELRPDVMSSQRVKVRVYFVDSTFPGVINVLARGRVGERQLAELADRVHEDARKDTGSGIAVLRVAVMHHPIEPVGTYNFTMYLDDASTVQNAFSNLGIGMVLCGH